ncbi:MAG TPA: glycosyltransferase [Solirubrobacteraceae bacterium]|jgi:glycosyltransferase involved in cell wall biosynthesis|nr:glycosyltransferase [Solirubrobacteraceae bacterium]
MDSESSAMPAEAAPAGGLPAASVTACLVIRNEEAVIERCLSSLEGVVDEIVVVHDGDCEDRTLEIAARHGCRVFVQPLVGHAESATVFAFEEARGEWILSLDADEFLSEPLREQLPRLVADPAVNGYELVWKMWDGRRYISERGPHKLALFRRSRVHVLGTVHAIEQVDPPVVRTELQLEHRPLYDNFTLALVMTKWRRWARIQAREYLGDLAALPRFNWEGTPAWPRRRRILNRLSPLLFPAYVPIAFVGHLLGARSIYGLRVNLKISFYHGLLAGMTQLYVARYLYFGATDDPASEPPRPVSASTYH